MMSEKKELSRRDFIRSTAALSLSTMGSLALAAEARKRGKNAGKGQGKRGGGRKNAANPATAPAPAMPMGSDTLKVGLIGCGGRGTGALEQCISGNEGVVVWAMGDLFRDKVDDAFAKFSNHNNPKIKDACQATRERCFDGFDAYKKVLDSGVDMVILATPPGFRPAHFAAAIQAGKHVFMEKPVAVDPAGLRLVIETAQKAKEQNLAVVAGTQRRHQKSYLETLQRIRDGAVGDILAGEVYWMMGGLWLKDRQPNWTDMEYQIRNWLYYDWLSGDHITEQHVHNLDVMCWVMGGPPVKAIGIGGRQVRTDPKYGNIYDHFAIEYEYANGVRIHAKCCQMEGSNNGRVVERFVGTKGFSQTASNQARLTDREGKVIWTFEGDQTDPYVQEHIDLVNAIRSKKLINEGEQVAISTACAILGRMAAYTGNEINFSWMMKASKLDLTPRKLEFGPNEVNPVPGPGKTKLI